MIQTKLFTGHFIGEYGTNSREFVEVDTEINDFLSKTEIKFVDVKFTSAATDGEIWSHALLIYKEL